MSCPASSPACMSAHSTNTLADGGHVVVVVLRCVHLSVSIVTPLYARTPLFLLDTVLSSLLFFLRIVFRLFTVLSLSLSQLCVCALSLLVSSLVVFRVVLTSSSSIIFSTRGESREGQVCLQQGTSVRTRIYIYIWHRVEEKEEEEEEDDHHEKHNHHKQTSMDKETNQYIHTYMHCILSCQREGQEGRVHKSHTKDETGARTRPIDFPSTLLTNSSCMRMCTCRHYASTSVQSCTCTTVLPTVCPSPSVRECVLRASGMEERP